MATQKIRPATTSKHLISTQVHDVLERCAEICKQYGIAFVAAYEDPARRVHTFQNLPPASDYPECFHHALKELGADV